MRILYKLFLGSALTLQQLVRGDQSEQGGAIAFRATQSSVKLIYVDARTKSEIRQERAGTLGRAQVHLGLHFDLDDRLNHPIFHAQVDHTCIHEDVIGRRYASIATRCDVPRIPTAPLDFAGVLYVLLHDHFPETVLKGWPATLREAIASLPRMPMASFSGCLAIGAHMECDWWYYHKHR